MANESTSSTLSELYTEIVAEAQFVASEKSIMRNLVKNYAISGGGKACRDTSSKLLDCIGFAN